MRAGPVTDRVGCKQDERVALPLPNLEFGFRFEDADQNWRRQRHALIAQTLLQYGDVWCPRQRQCSDGGRPLTLDPIGGHILELDGKRICVLGAGDTECHRREKCQTEDALECHECSATE